MKLAFVLDPLEGLDPAVDTTVGMIEAAQDRGHDVWVVETRDLAVLDGRAHARLRRIRVATAVRRAGRFVLPSPCFGFTDDAGEWLPLESMDGVFFRPDPPLDQAYLHATYILDLVDRDRTLSTTPAGSAWPTRSCSPFSSPNWCRGGSVRARCVTSCVAQCACTSCTTPLRALSTARG